MTQITTKLLALLLCVFAFLALSACALCPSMDDNCALIRHMNGEVDSGYHPTPEQACNDQHGKVVLQAGEFYRCDPVQ